ncbi:MAG: hypothetical protein ACM3ST_09915, partial [Bdellovibrio bacteriovorus]
LCMGFAGVAVGASSGPQTFSDALRAAGWGVEVLADGSLQLTPLGRSTQGPTPEAESQSPSPPVDPQAQPPGAPIGDSVDWTLLRSSGWRVERDADQAILLFPPGSVVPADSAPAPLAPADVPERSAVAAPDLETLLAVRGWRVERESDGTLMLHPLFGASPGLSVSARSLGQVPTAVAEGRVSVPVDTWEKARAVAASWLESVGDPVLRLGKIRRIHDVYVISIVGASPPHTLRHQVSVAVDDGRVLVLK